MSLIRKDEPHLHRATDSVRWSTLQYINSGTGITMKISIISTTLVAILLLATSAFSETTSSLTGTITTDGNPLAGATVTVSSPALQRTRTTVTGDSGGYSFSGLNPGVYTVRAERAGLASIAQQVTLSLAQTSRVDADLKVGSVSESIEVTAWTPAVLETRGSATNFTSREIARLPVPRTIRGTVLLAPGISVSGAANAIGISGGPANDSLFLVNGVVVNENLGGQPHNLFIEDAIQETTVMTSGISAEYGRFTGGVVNTLTKSGGNEYSGSLRESFANPSWTDKTPFRDSQGNPQADPVDEVDRIFEGTLGGRVIRDRLWFFAAGRLAETAAQRSTAFTNLQFTNTLDEKRWEGKLTSSVTPKHNLVASYLNIDLTEFNSSVGAILDTDSLVDRSSSPNSLRALQYGGILARNFALEARFAEKESGLINRGGRFTDRVKGTYIRDLSRGAFFGAPLFCGVCSPSERNNRSWMAKATYYLDTASLGNHSLVLGVENFAETRIENNHQSGSDFTISSSGSVIQGSKVFPRFDGNTTLSWAPILKNSEGTDFQTDSIFLNDRWALNNNFSFNLGVRFDKNDGKDADGHLVSDDSGWSPRLGMTYDARGNGRHRLSATVGRYISKILDGGVGSAAQAAGSAATLGFRYAGPVINGPGAAPLVPTHEAIRQLFAWFDSVGGTNNREFLTSTSVPGFSTRFDEGIESPSMDEITLGYGVQIGSNGFAKIDGISRKWQNFYAGQLDTSTGQIVDPFGNRGDQSRVINDDRETERKYRGVQLQAAWRPRRFSFGGGYTWSRLEGNDDSSDGVPGTPNSKFYPEYLDYAQRRPYGQLIQDQTHRARVWAGFDQTTVIGDFNLSALHNYDSGRVFSSAGFIDASGRLAGNSFANPPSNPGYTLSQLGFTHTYFFSERNAFRLDDSHSTDVAINYGLPIRRLELFVSASVINVFNNDAVIDRGFIDRTVRTRRTAGGAAGLKAFNPKTETPIQCPQGASAATCTALGAHFQLSPTFGKPSRFEAYQLPRTYRFSTGIRF
ncbi:MAG TPA: TonB-dependent receptor [Thermoanaerobaculia bacterium]|nr:TonB-dependent receptor [Thermoanaerobaculia bacterium]